MGLVGRDLRPDEAEPPSDAVDVRVNRHGGESEGEAEDDGRCLWADAVEALEPVLRIVEGHLGEERQVKRTDLVMDLIQHLLDAGRFDAEQPGPPDRLLDLFHIRRRDGLQGAERVHEVLEGPLGVDVRRVLREDGVDQLRGGVVARLPVERAVLGAEGVHYLDRRHALDSGSHRKTSKGEC